MKSKQKSIRLYVTIFSLIFISSCGVYKNTLTIMSGAMNPTINYEQKIVVDYSYYRFGPLPERYDIILFKSPRHRETSIYCLRVVAKPGETVMIRDREVTSILANNGRIKLPHLMRKMPRIPKVLFSGKEEEIFIPPKNSVVDLTKANLRDFVYIKNIAIQEHSNVTVRFLTKRNNTFCDNCKIKIERGSEYDSFISQFEFDMRESFFANRNRCLNGEDIRNVELAFSSKPGILYKIKNKSYRFSSILVSQIRLEFFDYYSMKSLLDYIKMIKPELRLIPILQIEGKTITRYKIVSQCYFVLGDNIVHSYDSRYWGFVSMRNIIARVVGKIDRKTGVSCF